MTPTVTLALFFLTRVSLSRYSFSRTSLLRLTFNSRLLISRRSSGLVLASYRLLPPDSRVQLTVSASGGGSRHVWHPRDPAKSREVQCPAQEGTAAVGEAATPWT